MSTDLTPKTQSGKQADAVLPRPAENLRSIKDENSAEGGYVYRYRDLVGDRADWVRQIIVDSQLYFAAPTMFNDPFDFRTRFRLGDRKAFRARLRERAQRIASESGLSRKKRRELERAEGRISPHSLLRDMTREAEKTIAAAVRVLSLSVSHENILMWSHYACGRQGVCLQFRVEAEDGFFANAQEVKYSPELPIVELLGDPMEYVDKVMLTKAEDWRYECEYRVVRTDGISNVRFPRQLLTGVILGAKISPAAKQCVCAWIKDRGGGMATYQARLHADEFALQFEQID